jgi:hypothetical protein
MQFRLRTLLMVMLLGGAATGCDPSNSQNVAAMKVEQSWPFDQAPNVAAITTQQVLDGKPILRVVHYEDDHSWAFTCGTTNDEADGRVISMEQAVDLDSTIKEVAGLLPGWRAWRSAAGGTWQREKMD